MTRTLKVYNGEDRTPIYDITDLVEWPDCEFGHRAHMGESTLSNLRFRDEDGRVGNAVGLPAGLQQLQLSAHNVVVWQESGVTMGRMRISPKDWTRGAQKAGRAREAEVTLEDYNSDLRNIVIHGYTRPAETDKARVQGVLASYLSGSPRRTTNLNGSNYVSSSNLVTLPATTYNRTNTAEVLASIAATANKLYFVTVDGELFYDGNDSTAYQTPFKISDRDTDLSDTVFAPQPGGFGPASSEDGQQLLSGLWLFYGESQYVHVTNPVAANQFSWWEDVIYDDTVTTATAATTLANAILAQRVNEERQIAVKIGPLTYGQAIQIKAGQLIQIKWRAIPDADDAYVSRRISELRWSTPEPFSFFADMILDRPIKLHGQGQKTDAVIPKSAPPVAEDTVVSPTTIYSFLYTTDNKDEQSHTLSGGLDRTTPGAPGSWPTASGYLGAAYGFNDAGAFLSEKLPISASTQYSFSEKFIFRYTPANRDTYVRWLDVGGSTLREDLWIDGSDYGIGVGYTKSILLTSPVGATDVRIRYSNFAGFFADDVYIETPGSVVAADDDEFALPDSGSSPYYMRSDDPRVLGLIDQMETVGFSWKMPVRVATTAAGTLASSFESGDTVDGVVLAAGDRILIKNQAAGADNGIYVVGITGAPTRATDFDTDEEAEGAACFVSEGTANGNAVYVCTTNAPVELGVTTLVFAQVSSSAALIVQEDDSTVDAAVTTLDFTTALNVTSSPAGEANIAVDLGTGSTQAAAGNHTHTAGDSAKASASGDLSGTTGTAADVTGATLSLAAGTYIVAGNFQVELNSGDRVFEGVLDVAGSDENDLAIWEAIGADDGDEQQVVQFWRITLGSTSTVKLQARHSGGTTGDFDVKAANTTLTAWTSAGTFGAWTDYTPTWTASTTNPTLGSTTIVGRYKQLDAKTYIVQFSVSITTGGAWNAGSGTYSVSLPSITSAARRQVGSATILDAGTRHYSGTSRVDASTTVMQLVIADASGTFLWQHNVPVTPATGDQIEANIMLEIA